MRTIQKKLLLLAVLSNVPLMLLGFELEQKCLDNTIQNLKKPDTQYQVNADKTITDMKTGLTWAACLYGTSGIGCTTGSPSSLNWDKSFGATTEDITNSDWRIPSIIELGSLVEPSCNKPALNVTRFRPILETFQSYKEYFLWSSTTDYSNPEKAYVLDVMTGKVLVKPKDISTETASFYTLMVKTTALTE